MPNSKNLATQSIHVIFSWAQIGRYAIFGREIGVPDIGTWLHCSVSKNNCKIVS